MDLTGMNPVIAAEAVERFWSKVDANGDCWIWTGTRDTNGYGLFHDTGHRLVRAHRFVFDVLMIGIPAGLHIDHLCRIPPCVNPDHLEPVPPRVNVLRGYAPCIRVMKLGRCKRGHSLDDALVQVFPDGRQHRTCRTCRQIGRGVPEDQIKPRRYEPATECKWGHALSGDNLITRQRRGWVERVCRECARARGRAYMARQRASR